MLSILGSLVSGGLTGILGTALTGILSYFKRKEENKLTIALKKEERETMKLKSDLDLKKISLLSETKLAGIQEQQAAAIKKESYANDKATYASSRARDSKWLVFVDFLRGIIRPTLTIYLIILTTFVYMEASDIVSAIGYERFEAAKAIAIVEEITATILYLTTTCVSWYFGNRSLEKHDLKLYGDKK